MKLGSMDVLEYIQDDLNSEPSHNCDSLAKAINDVADELDCNTHKLMWLLL